MVPKIKTAQYKISTFARVRDIRSFFKGAEKCANRNSSIAHVVLPQLDPVSELYLEDGDDPGLGSGPYGGRPLTPQELQEGWPEMPPSPRPQSPAEDAADFEPSDGATGKVPETISHNPNTFVGPGTQDAKDVRWMTYLQELRKYKVLDEREELPNTVVPPAGTIQYYWFDRDKQDFLNRVATHRPLERLAEVPMSERSRVAKLAASFYRYMESAAVHTGQVADLESVAYAYDGLARATAGCPAFTAEEFEEWTGSRAPESFKDATVQRFLIAGANLLDLTGSTQEMRAEAADRLERAGEAITARRLMQIVEEIKSDAAKARASTAAGESPAEDERAAAPDEPETIASSAGEEDQSALSEPASTAETYATPQQIAGLKRLAQQVGDDASMDVQDMLDHHPEGLVIGVYEIVKQRLKARRATQKEELSGKR